MNNNELTPEDKDFITELQESIKKLHELYIALKERRDNEQADNKDNSNTKLCEKCCGKIGCYCDNSRLNPHNCKQPDNEQQAPVEITEQKERFDVWVEENENVFGDHSIIICTKGKDIFTETEAIKISELIRETLKNL